MNTNNLEALLCGTSPAQSEKVNQELMDYIYGIPNFNDCSFCQKFHLHEKCPAVDFYDDENPDLKKIEEGAEICKRYVYSNLKKMFEQPKPKVTVRANAFER